MRDLRRSDFDDGHCPILPATTKHTKASRVKGRARGCELQQDLPLLGCFCSSR